MPTTTVTPTSFTTQDPAQGGLPVTGATNTGHANTSVSAAGDDIGVSQEKSCLWTGFTNVSGSPITKTLKITHTSQGSFSGASATNIFTLEYSLNGGGAWSTAVSRVAMTTSQGPTVFSVALPASQDLTQVRVRDFMQAIAVNIGHSAAADATISDINIEIATQDVQVVILM